jgi:hypothetical protein
VLKVSVKLGIQQARRMFKDMEREVNKAAGRALNRVATTVRKEADQEVRKRLSLKSSTVKGNIIVTRPWGRNSLIRDVVAKGGPIPLREYSARPTKKGATFRIGPGKPRKVYKRKSFVGFINPKWGGGHVFVATGINPLGPEKNAPIKKVYGPGIAQGFTAKRTRERMQATLAERWPIEFTREMKYRMGKAGVTL